MQARQASPLPARGLATARSCPRKAGSSDVVNVQKPGWEDFGSAWGVTIRIQPAITTRSYGLRRSLDQGLIEIPVRWRYRR